MQKISNEPISQRKIPKFYQSENQRSPSEHLFLNFIRNLLIVYICISFLYLPIFIGLVSIEKTFLEAENTDLDLYEVVLIGTFSTPSRANLCQSQIIDKNINNNKVISDNCKITKTTKIDYLGQMTIQIFQRLSLYFDMFVQVLLLIGTFFMEYRSHLSKKISEDRYIDNYSIEISQLPRLQNYKLLSKINHYLLDRLNCSNQQQQEKCQILDIEAAFSKKQTKLRILSSRLQLMLLKKQDYLQKGQQKMAEKAQFKIKQIKLLIKQQQILGKEDQQIIRCVWVTFASVKQRQFALKQLQKRQNGLKYYFQGSQLKINKAPSPQQIIWQNLYLSQLKRYLFRLGIIGLSLLLVVLADILILFMQRQLNIKLMTPILVLLLQIALKSFIIQISVFEKHKLKSRQDLSTLRKLTLFLYLNSGIVTFISSYNLQNTLVCSWFSSCLYSSLNYQWYRSVGSSLILTFLIQIFYLNFRVYWDYFKKICIQFFIGYYLWFRSLSRYQKQFKKSKVDLDILYGHVLSVILMANTYTHAFPVFYPLTCILLSSILISHNRYIIFYTQTPPYNNDKLDDTAIKFIFQSIIFHLLFVSYTESFKPSFVLFIILLSLYIFRTFLLSYFSRYLRKRKGPILQTNQIRRQNSRLLQVMSKSNITEKMFELEKRRQQIDLLIAKNINLQEQSLQQYRKILEDRICKFRKECQSKKSQGLKGKLSYKIYSQQKSDNISNTNQLVTNRIIFQKENVLDVMNFKDMNFDK